FARGLTAVRDGLPSSLRTHESSAIHTDALPCLTAVRDGLPSSLRTHESSAIHTDALPSFPRKRKSSVVHVKTLGPSDPAPAKAGGGDDVEFPAPTRDIVGLGVDRLADYQDGAYVELYRERLTRIVAADRAIDPDDT